MASGVPLVTTRVGQAPDIVESRGNGLLVDVEDPGALPRPCSSSAQTELSPLRSPRRDVAPPRSTPTNASTRRGRSCWMDSSSGTNGMQGIDAARVGRYSRAGARWARLLASRRAAPGLRIFYGHDRVPSPGERAAGGTAKAQKLAERFPNSPGDFSLLYLGSTWLPRDLRPLLWLARRRGASIVVNQDGVAYPGWAGERTDELNSTLRRALLAADHVLYQSEFSKSSADHFLGEPVRPGRSSRTPSTSVASRLRRPRSRAVRSCCSEATRPRRIGSSSGCGRSRL